MGLARGAALAGVLLLAGCAAFRLPGDEAPAERDYSNIDPQVADLPGGAPIAAPPLPPRRPAPPDGLALAAPVSAPLGAVETMTEVNTLVGLDFGETRDLLGEPTLQEVQPPAEIWSYNGPDCVLNIFFYPQVGGEQYRALAYDVVEPAPNEQSAQRCFTALLAQKRKPSPDAPGRTGAVEEGPPGLSDATGAAPREAVAASPSN